MIQFGSTCSSLLGSAIPFLPIFFMTVLSWILLHEIRQKFACIILTLKSAINVIFCGHRRVRGHCTRNFSRIFRIMQILSSTERNRAKFYMEGAYKK